MKNKIGRRLVFFVLLITLFIPSSFAAFPQSFSDIVKKEKSKVVHVLNTSVSKTKVPQVFQDFFGNQIPQQDRRRTASGSGFFVSPDGYILTNNHVIDKAESLTVILGDETSYKANVVGKDPRTDLALIKIDIKKASYVRFGNSDKLKIGDWVVAIGNPLGLDFTVTAGILSAKGRDIFGGTAYGDFLQTDAAINRGNSGGPLFNTRGEVIGINTAIVVGGQGLGFAIPSNLAVKIMDELKKNGEVRRGWLGVGIQNVTLELSANFKLPKGTKGVVITGIQKKSPADKAGLKSGDVVVTYNGKKVEKSTQLQKYVAETKIGQRVTIQIYREGKKIAKKVRIVLVPENLSNVKIESGLEKYGMGLSSMDRRLKERLGLKQTYGLIIRSLIKNGLAQQNDLRVGDVILEVNKVKIRNINDFKNALKKSSQGKALLLIYRNKTTIFRSLPVN